MKHLLPLLLCCAVWPVPAAEPTALRFQRVVIDDKPPQSPWVKIAGDLNGDGKPDIIIGGAQGPLVWYRNPGWKKSVIATGGYNTVAGEAVDIDGDRFAYQGGHRRPQRRWPARHHPGPGGTQGRLAPHRVV